MSLFRVYVDGALFYHPQKFTSPFPKIETRAARLFPSHASYCARSRMIWA